MYRLEEKAKIQQYIVDVLALGIETSPDQTKTKMLLLKSMDMTTDVKAAMSDDSKEGKFFQSIIERQKKGQLPYMNEEDFIEFPVPVQPKSENEDSTMRLPSQNFYEMKKKEEEKRIAQKLQNVEVESPVRTRLDQESRKSEDFRRPEPMAAQYEKPPSQGDKIGMWLPSYPTEPSNKRIEARNAYARQQIND